MKLICHWVKGLTLFVLISFLLPFLFSAKTFAAPVANISGPDVVLAGDIVKLSGSSSIGKQLKYKWTVIDAPNDTRLNVNKLNDSQITFQASRVGKYQIELKVLEGRAWSRPKNIIILSIMSAGKSLFTAEDFSAPLSCKMTFGFYGCEDVIKNFQVEDPDGNYSIVVENDGVKKANISLNGMPLNDDFSFGHNNEVAVKKIAVLKNNQLKIRFKSNGLFNYAFGSFKVKILRNRKLDVEKAKNYFALNNDSDKSNVESEDNLPPQPTAQDLKVLQNFQGVTRIFPNDQNSSQKHLYTVVISPKNGSVVVTSEGIVYFVPKENFFGSDQIVINVKDNGTPSLSTNVSINILVEQNLPPNPLAENIVTMQGAPGQTQVFPNDPNTIPQFFKYDIAEKPANGIVSIYGSRFVYRANPGYVGNDSFIVRVSDDGVPSLSGFKTISVNVKPNTVPQIVADDIVTFQSKTVSNQVHFIDPDAGQSHSFGISLAPTHGTATISSEGVLAYTPDVGYFGSDSVTIYVKDSAIPAGVGTKLIPITVTANSIPVVIANDFVTFQSKPITTRVSFTDSNENQKHTYFISTRPSHGSALLTQEGNLTYTPTPGYSGTDSLVVAVSDSAIPAGIGRKTVRINVTPNTIPVVLGENIVTVPGQSSTTQISYSDPDEGQAHVLNISRKPIHGTATLAQDGLLTYLPAQGYSGNDSLEVAVSDSAIPAGVGYRTISISVLSNTVPVVAASDITTFQSLSATTLVTYTDPDPGQTHSFSISSQASHGSVSINQQGIATYSPVIGYFGSDSFIVAVSDSATPSGVGTKTVHVSITANSIPVISAPDINIFQGNQGTSHVSYVDPDLGQNHLVEIQTNPQHGFVYIDPLQNAVYTPATRCSVHPDSFVVKVSDDALPPGIGTKVINVIPEANSKPNVTVADFSIEQNQTISQQVQATDANGDVLSYSIKQMPAHGLASISNTGLLTYSHLSVDAATEDTIQISVKDKFGDCLGQEVLKTVYVHIQPNRAPSLKQIANMVIELNTTAHALAEGSDVDRYQALTYVITSQPANGAVLISASGGIEYTPNSNFVGDDQFTVSVRDNGQPILMAEQVVHVSVLPFNYPPVPTSPGFAVLSGNFSETHISPGDPDLSQVHHYEIISTPTLGTVSVSNLGVLTFSANPGVEGVEEVQVRVTDNGTIPKSAIAYVPIEVVRNLAPAPANVNIAKLVSGMSSTFTVNPNDPNEARFPGHYTFDISSAPDVGNVQINSSGVVIYTAPIGFVGTVHFEVAVSDDGTPALTGRAAVSINVVANSTPVVATKSLVTPQNTGIDKQVEFTDADSNLQTFTYDIALLPQHGAATIDTNGLLHYQPALNYIGGDSFQVRVTDNGNPALSGIATYNVNVVDTNNQPPTFASFTHGFRDSVLPVLVEFDLNGLTDPDGHVDEVRVNFGDGSETLVLNKNDLGPKNGLQVLDHFEHFYIANGTYNVVATIVDNLGALVTTQTTVKIGTNAPPVARMTFSNMQGPVPLTVGVNGTSSTDSDGSIVKYTVSITKYDTGVEIYKNTQAGIPNLGYAITSAGVYRINVCVYDNGNAYSCMDQLAYAGVDRPDMGSRLAYASFKATPRQGGAPLAVLLDASASKGAQGAAIASYQWVITGNPSEEFGRNITYYFTGMKPDLEIPVTGVFEITLSVLDVNGNSASSKTKILVTGTNNPTPELIAVNYGNRSFGFRLETHGAPIDSNSVFWDLGEAKKAKGMEAFITYSSNDIYTVKMQALDVYGHKYNLTKTIDFNQDLTAPQIFVTGGQQKTYQENEFITIDASATSDIHGPLTFTWNFGDGTPTITGVGNDFARVTHAYSEKGSKRWELRVTNSQGLSSLFSFDTNIIVGEIPTLYATVSPEYGLAPQAVTASVFYDEFYINILGYQWNFGQFSGGQLVDGGRTMTNTYFKPGTYPVSVTALDTNGNLTTAFAGTVNIYDYNKHPIVLTETLTTKKNKKLNYTVEFTDDDKVAQLHTFSISQLPAHGSAVIDQKGRLIYQPATDFIGTDTVKVQVTDNSYFPGIGTGTFTINVLGDTNALPIIGALDYSYETNSYPQQVLIEASSLVDPDGEISKVVWDFGDGSNQITVDKTIVTSIDQLKSISHLYQSSGNYNITMTAFDNEGDSVSQQITAELGNNSPPILSFDSHLYGTQVPFQLYITAGTSVDRDGSVSRFCLNVSKDGKTINDQCGASSAPNAFLNEPGLYKVKLYVQDNNHGRRTKYYDLLVDASSHEFADISPISVIRTANSRIGEAPLNINMDSSDSRAVDRDFNQKRITDRIWVLSDKELAGRFLNNETASFNYSIPGTHYANLTVIDNVGMRSTESLPVFIGPAPELHADFTAQSADGVNYNFNAATWSNGHIPDFYFWDFGDGTVGSGRYFIHNYNRAGNFKVTLTVMDVSGNLSFATQDLIVGASSDGIRGFLYDQSGVNKKFATTNAAVQFSYFKGYPEYLVKWSFGDGQFAEGTLSGLSNISHTYANPGIYPMKLAVTNPYTGKTKEFNQIVNVKSVSQNIEVLPVTSELKTDFPASIHIAPGLSLNAQPTQIDLIISDEFGPLKYVDLFHTNDFSYLFNQRKKYKLEVYAKDQNGSEDVGVIVLDFTGAIPKKIFENVTLYPSMNAGDNKTKEQFKILNILKNN